MEKMMRKSIKPGRVFWVGTFVVGVFSPGRGKRRVNDRMVWVDGQYKVALTRIAALEEELATAYAALEQRTEVPLQRCVGEIAECPVHGDREETVPLPRVTAATVLVRRLAEVPGVSDLPRPEVRAGK